MGQCLVRGLPFRSRSLTTQACILSRMQYPVPDTASVVVVDGAGQLHMLNVCRRVETVVIRHTEDWWWTFRQSGGEHTPFINAKLATACEIHV